MKEKIKCHICDSECRIALTAMDKRYVSTPEQEFKIYECPSCGAGQTVPRPENIGDYYIKEYYDKRIRTAAGDDQTILDWFSDRYESLLGIDKSIPGKKGKLLEIGCGPGHDLVDLSEQGWEVTGIEPNKSAVEMGRAQYDFTIHHGTLDDMANQLEPSSFDVVLLNHVFEHIPNPHETIFHIKDILAPTGLVVIEVPNFDSALRQVLGEFWRDHDVPRHVYHYTPQSLDILMEQQGFRRTSASYYKGALLGAAWTSNYITAKYKYHTRAAYFFPFFIPIGLLLGLRKKTRFRQIYTPCG